MKIIDLLNKIANGEIKEGFRIKSKKGGIYEYKEGKDCFYNIENPVYIYPLGDFTELNDEIEIIEEKPISLKPFKNYLEDTSDLPQIDKDNRIIEYIHQMSLKINYLLEKESDK